MRMIPDTLLKEAENRLKSRDENIVNIQAICSVVGPGNQQLTLVVNYPNTTEEYSLEIQNCKNAPKAATYRMLLGRLVDLFEKHLIEGAPVHTHGYKLEDVFGFRRWKH